MKRRLYFVMMRHLLELAEHLHAVDLDALADDARVMGTDAEIRLVDALREARSKIPRVRR